MTQFPFARNLRGRLLALMALIILPVAALSFILASTTYRSVLEGIEAAQVQTTSSYAVRARVWFRGSLRALIATVASVEAIAGDDADCTSIGTAVVASIEGFQAVRLRLASGTTCFAALPGGLTADEVANVAGTQMDLPPTGTWAGSDPTEIRYDAMMVGGALHLVLHARAPGPSGWEAMLLMDPAVLRLAFQIGTADGTGEIALIKRDGTVVVARGVSEQATGWLPARGLSNIQDDRWMEQAQAGGRFRYVSQSVAVPDLFVLARFDDAASRAAWLQFLVLCITPLLTLALLFIAYATVIESQVVRWITGIKNAALARVQHNEGLVLAPIDDSMPEDIRRLAEAYNNMIGITVRRERELSETLDANYHLMRELHHRVKNSLQVIQSYLALSRRQRVPGRDPMIIAETEAKVLVLSTAYRLALTDGGMRSVYIHAFTDELIGAIERIARRPQQTITLSVETGEGLVVDRIIPLGLALVECLLAEMRTPEAEAMTIRIGNLDDGNLELRVTSDFPGLGELLPPRIMAGLAAQLEASEAALAPGDVLRWRFKA